MINRLASSTVDIRWSDMDAFGHVNNARFHTFIEEARLRWLQSLPAPWVTDDIGPLLAAVQMNFRRPVGWPETLRITLGVLRVGDSSLTLSHVVTSAGSDAAVYADGHAVMVWIDRRNGRPISLPPELRAVAESAAAST